MEGIKVQTSSYKTTKDWGWDVRHDSCSKRCHMVYGRVVKRVDPQSSYPKKSFFFFLLYLSEMMDDN